MGCIKSDHLMDRVLKITDSVVNHVSFLDLIFKQMMFVLGLYIYVCVR